MVLLLSIFWYPMNQLVQSNYASSVEERPSVKVSSSAKNSSIRPFLKWAGGKGQLLEQMSNFLPRELIDGSIKRYVEPFIGGGAMFFFIASAYTDLEFFIYDINPELILAYKTIKQDVNLLGEMLLEIQSHYWSLSESEKSQYFYQVRESFNYQKSQIDFNGFNRRWIERTAQIIFLNRTCFNGLFRVNSQGKFNVPIGRYKKPKICNLENLQAVSKILQNTQIELGDFTACKKLIDSDTFVYFDPPYRPISNTANFTSYSENSFDDKEQLRLRNFFQDLNSFGAKLLLSNSDPKNQNGDDNFFEDAYQSYRIERVRASRNISSNSSTRGQINELLIMNY
jgi:DNA adenine methylase